MMKQGAKFLSLREYASYLMPGCDAVGTPLQSCELCGRQQFSNISGVCRVGTGVYVDNPVLCCEHCGLLFQAVRFDISFYDAYYARVYKSKVLPKSELSNYAADQVARGHHLFSHLVNFIKPQGRVLDVGCSLGGLLTPFKEAGWQVCGIDPDIESIESGKAMFGIDLTVGSAESIKYEEEFDLIIITGSLEHVADLRLSLGRISRALRPGGMILIEGWALAQAKLCGQFGHNQKRYLNRYSLQTILHNYGFESVFIRQENLCGPTRPGSTFALGRRVGELDENHVAGAEASELQRYLADLRSGMGLVQ